MQRCTLRKTPADYDNGYLKPIAIAKLEEARLLSEAKKSLATIFGEQQTDLISKALESVRTLKEIPVNQDVEIDDVHSNFYLSMAVARKELAGPKIMIEDNKISEILSPLKNPNEEKPLETVQENLDKILREKIVSADKKDAGRLRMQARQILLGVIGKMESAIQLEKAMRTLELSTKEEIQSFLEIHMTSWEGVKKFVDDQVEALPEGSEVDLSYNKQAYAVPSDAWNNARCLSYNAPYLKHSGVIYATILRSIGVIDVVETH